MALSEKPKKSEKGLGLEKPLIDLGKTLLLSGKAVANTGKKLSKAAELLGTSLYNSVLDIPESSEGKLEEAKKISQKHIERLKELELLIVNFHSNKDIHLTKKSLEEHESLREGTMSFLYLLASECEDEKIKNEIEKIAKVFHKESYPKANFNEIRHDILTNFKGCQ